MLPELPKYYFAFGTALHEVMEYIYNPENPAFPTLAEALSFFQTHWNSTTFEQKGYASAEKEALGYEEGRRIISAYYDKYGAALVHPLSVEMKSTMELDGLSLTSILDRIDYLGDGRIKILDYKTGKTVQREPDQLMMYQKVAESSPAVLNLVKKLDPKIKQVQVETLSFYHLPSLQELSFERVSDKEMYAFWQKVLGVADQIRAGQFTPAPEENKCRWCDYHNICPVFTGKEYDGPSGWGAKIPDVPPPTHNPFDSRSEVPAALQQSAAAPSPKTETEILTEKIDRLGEITHEQRRLRQEIMALMEKLGYKRHFGTKFRAELVQTQKLEFPDKQKTIDTLRELHLLAKTLVPTQSSIAALLSDDSTSAEAKAKLEALLSKTQQTDLEITEAE